MQPALVLLVFAAVTAAPAIVPAIAQQAMTASVPTIDPPAPTTIPCSDPAAVTCTVDVTVRDCVRADCPLPPESPSACSGCGGWGNLKILCWEQRVGETEQTWCLINWDYTPFGKGGLISAAIEKESKPIVDVLIPDETARSPAGTVFVTWYNTIDGIPVATGAFKLAAKSVREHGPSGEVRDEVYVVGKERAPDPVVNAPMTISGCADHRELTIGCDCNRPHEWNRCGPDMCWSHSCASCGVFSCGPRAIAGRHLPMGCTASTGVMDGYELPCEGSDVEVWQECPEVQSEGLPKIMIVRPCRVLPPTNLP